MRSRRTWSRRAWSRRTWSRGASFEVLLLAEKPSIQNEKRNHAARRRFRVT